MLIWKDKDERILEKHLTLGYKLHKYTRHRVKMSSMDLPCVILPQMPTSQWKFSVTLTGVEGAQMGQMLLVRWGGGSYWQANVETLRWSPRGPLPADAIASAGGDGEGGQSHRVRAKMSCSCCDWPPPRGDWFTTAGEKPSPHPRPLQGSERSLSPDQLDFWQIRDELREFQKSMTPTTPLIKSPPFSSPCLSSHNLRTWPVWKQTFGPAGISAAPWGPSSFTLLCISDGKRHRSVGELYSI